MSGQLPYRKLDMTADLIQFARRSSPRFAFHVINQIHYAGGRVGRPDRRSIASLLPSRLFLWSLHAVELIVIARVTDSDVHPTLHN